MHTRGRGRRGRKTVCHSKRSKHSRVQALQRNSQLREERPECPALCDELEEMKRAARKRTLNVPVYHFDGG